MSRPAGLRATGAAAPVARWLLWTRRRAVLSVAALLLGAVVLTHLTAILGTVAPPRIAAPSMAAPPTPAAGPAPVLAPPTPVGLVPISGGPPPGTSPADVAVGFATRWVDHGGDPARWASFLAPWSTPEYGEQTLPSVDPATVPASRVTGPARLIQATATSAQVDIPLDALTIRVLLLNATDPTTAPTTGAQWRVNDLTPAPPS